MNQNLRQFFVSFALSCVVFFGLSYFWGDKKEEQPASKPAETVKKQAIGERARERDMLNVQERIFFKTGPVSGSINKLGCKLDLLQLALYKQNIDSEKPVSLLQPEFGGRDFFSSMLFKGDDVPEQQTLWDAQGDGYVFENKTWKIEQKIEFTGYRVNWTVICKNISQTPKR